MADQIEHEIQAKGLTAPRVTPADIEANIASEHYFTGAEATGCLDDSALKQLTFCVLKLRNGFTVTGESACASPENFDAEVGRKIARQNAVQKIWPLMGYELRTQLAMSQCDDEATTALDRHFAESAERMKWLRSIGAQLQPTKQECVKKQIGRAAMALVAIIGGCVGNQVGHQTVAAECERLGAFYVGDVTYRCAVKAPFSVEKP